MADKIQEVLDRITFKTRPRSSSVPLRTLDRGGSVGDLQGGDAIQTRHREMMNEIKTQSSAIDDMKRQINDEYKELERKYLDTAELLANLREQRKELDLELSDRDKFVHKHKGSYDKGFDSSDSDEYERGAKSRSEFLSDGTKPPMFVKQHSFNSNSYKKIKSFKLLIGEPAMVTKLPIPELLNHFSRTARMSPQLQLSNVEYNTTLMQYLPDRLRYIVAKNIENDGQNSPEVLHESILLFSGEYTPLYTRLEKFQRYKPSGNENNLQEIANQVTSLGVIAEMPTKTIVEKFLSVLPTMARQHIDLYKTIHKNIKLDIVRVLSVLSPYTGAINSALKNMYKPKPVLHVTKEGDSSSNTARKGDSSNYTKRFCIHCLRQNHTSEKCYRKGHTPCLLCGNNHITPECTIYQGVNPVFLPCKKCQGRGVSLHHPEKLCVQQ